MVDHQPPERQPPERQTPAERVHALRGRLWWFVVRVIQRQLSGSQGEVTALEQALRLQERLAAQRLRQGRGHRRLAHARGALHGQVSGALHGGGNL